MLGIPPPEFYRAVIYIFFIERGIRARQRIERERDRERDRQPGEIVGQLA
jgi:hypothetical protein